MYMQINTKCVNFKIFIATYLIVMLYIHKKQLTQLLPDILPRQNTYWHIEQKYCHKLQYTNIKMGEKCENKNYRQRQVGCCDFLSGTLGRWNGQRWATLEWRENGFLSPLQSPTANQECRENKQVCIATRKQQASFTT